MSKTTEATNGCEAWAVTDSAAMAEHAEEGGKTYNRLKHQEWKPQACGILPRPDRRVRLLFLGFL